MNGSKWLLGLLVCASVMFFVACGSGGGEGSGGGMPSPTLPSVPAAKGGELTETDGDNEKVTKEKLDDFLAEAVSAIAEGDVMFRSVRARAIRADSRPEEKEEGTGTQKESFSFIGLESGRADVTTNFEMGGVDNDQNGKFITKGTQTAKLFNFSNSGNLYFGGAIGMASVSENNYKYDAGNEESITKAEGKINGTIKFAGKYEGEIVFENFTAKYEVEYLGYDEDTYEDIYDTISSNITGKCFVRNKDGSTVDLPEELALQFQVYSPKRDYGEKEIKRPSLPSVPSASGGNLSSHEGDNEAVEEDNFEEFLEYLSDALYYYDYDVDAPAEPSAALRALSESTNKGSGVERGSNSGYYSYNWNETGKSMDNEDDEQSVSTGTETAKYFDYSNSGELFLGGAWAEANVNYYSWSNGGENSLDLYESKVNGTLKFNGKFEGSVVFNNFHFEEEYNSGKTKILGGSVTIKSGGKDLKVPEVFLEMIVSYFF